MGVPGLDAPSGDVVTDAPACRSADPEIFFPPSYNGSYRDVVRAAKALCEGCAVRPACLRRGLEVSENFGIWGGTTPYERSLVPIRAKRRVS